MNIPRPIDDQLVTLLHEITDDPSKLLAGFTQRLRSTPHGLPKSMALDEDGFFDQAERRMLRRHREELGDLLNERCLLYLKGDYSDSTLIEWRYKGAGSREVSRRQAIELRHIGGLDWDDASKIKSGIQMPIGGFNLAEVCELAQALCPTFRIRSVLGTCLKKIGQVRAAVEVWESMNRDEQDPVKKTSLLGNLGSAACVQKQYIASNKYYREAVRLGSNSIASLSDWFVTEVFCGRRDGILEASRELGLAVNGDINKIDRQVEALRGNCNKYRESIQSNQLNLVIRLIDDLTDPARKLANAIAEKE